jgi:hypothetical protein
MAKVSTKRAPSTRKTKSARREHDIRSKAAIKAQAARAKNYGAKKEHEIRSAAAKQAAETRIGQPRYPESAKIHVLPKGKENPRREGLGPYRRYAVLLKSKTVGDFLKELPDWRSTINRAVKEERIKVQE